MAVICVKEQVKRADGSYDTVYKATTAGLVETENGSNAQAELSKCVRAADEEISGIVWDDFGPCVLSGVHLVFSSGEDVDSSRILLYPTGSEDLQSSLPYYYQKLDQFHEEIENCQGSVESFVSSKGIESEMNSAMVSLAVTQDISNFRFLKMMDQNGKSMTPGLWMAHPKSEDAVMYAFMDGASADITFLISGDIPEKGKIIALQTSNFSQWSVCPCKHGSGILTVQGVTSESTTSMYFVFVGAN